MEIHERGLWFIDGCQILESSTCLKINSQTEAQESGEISRQTIQICISNIPRRTSSNLKESFHPQAKYWEVHHTTDFRCLRTASRTMWRRILRKNFSRNSHLIRYLRISHTITLRLRSKMRSCYNITWLLACHRSLIWSLLSTLNCTKMCLTTTIICPYQGQSTIITRITNNSMQLKTICGKSRLQALT